MTSVRVDFGALRQGAAQLGHASESFGQGSGQVGATPSAAAPDPNVTGLMDRVITAIAGSLRKAAGELDEIAGGLGNTAASYERTEQMLASWHVPGGTAP